MTRLTPESAEGLPQKVSERLSQIAGKRQVIAITHLPQIAAMADSHYLIEKTSDNNSTISRIYRLSEEESVEELARMLGGAEITSTVLDNAREMKKFASTAQPRRVRTIRILSNKKM